MTTVVLGAGSIGCFVGAHLIRGGEPVVLLGRPALADAVARGGLRVTDLNGADWQLPAERVTVATDPGCLAGAEQVLLCTKSTGTAQAAEQIAAHAPATVTVVSLQNGVANPAVLRQRLPQATIHAGMVPYNVIWTDGAHFHNGTSGQIELAAEAAAIAERFQACGLAAQAHPDITGVQWGKLVVNLNNATNALSGQPLKAQLADRDYRRATATAQLEALGLLRRAGISVQRSGRLLPKLTPHVLRCPTWLFERVAAQMVKIDPQARSSMQDDLDQGRATEVDYLNGEVVRLAERLGREAPVNGRVVALIREAEQQGRSPKLTGAALRKALGI